MAPGSRHPWRFAQWGGPGSASRGDFADGAVAVVMIEVMSDERRFPSDVLEPESSTGRLSLAGSSGNFGGRADNRFRPCAREVYGPAATARYGLPHPLAGAPIRRCDSARPGASDFSLSLNQTGRLRIVDNDHITGDIDFAYIHLRRIPKNVPCKKRKARRWGLPRDG